MCRRGCVEPLSRYCRSIELSKSQSPTDPAMGVTTRNALPEWSAQSSSKVCVDFLHFVGRSWRHTVVMLKHELSELLAIDQNDLRLEY